MQTWITYVLLIFLLPYFPTKSNSQTDKSLNYKIHTLNFRENQIIEFFLPFPNIMQTNINEDNLPGNLYRIDNQFILDIAGNNKKNLLFISACKPQNRSNPDLASPENSSYSEAINNLSNKKEYYRYELITPKDSMFIDLPSENTLSYTEHIETIVKGVGQSGCPIHSCTPFHVVDYCLYLRCNYHSAQRGFCVTHCVDSQQSNRKCESCDYEIVTGHPGGPLIDIICILYYPRFITGCCYSSNLE